MEYPNIVIEEIKASPITERYKIALINCVDNLFSPDQLNYPKKGEEFEKKRIFAKRDLVLTRTHATQADLQAIIAYDLEARILATYEGYISSVL
jgi:hypothetical protein